MTKAFLDTSYIVAIASPKDKHHKQATQLAGWMQQEKVAAFTTRAVLLEVGNALSKYRHRQEAVRLLNLIEHDSAIEIVPMSNNLYVKAFTLFQSRMDKEWGLVDCVSCIVMQEQGIAQVLTADDHFRQMGFQALLKD